MILRTAAVLASAITLVACNPAVEGDGKGQTTLSFEGSQATRDAVRLLPRSTVSNLNVTDTAGNIVGSITLTDAWVVIKEIEFEHEDDAEDAADLDSDKLEFIGPFAVDLLTGTSYPSLPTINIDTGIYEDIEFDIEKLDSNDLVGMPDLPQSISDILVDNSLSMYMEGTYSSTDGDYSAIPFSLSYDQTDEFELSGTELTNGFVIDDTGANDIIVAFRMQEWFRFDNTDTNGDGLAFETAVNGAGDAIVLDGNTNNDIMDVIEDNIEDSAEYGEDDDGDGELDEDEDDD